MKNFAALLAGLIFGIGLVISQMVNPAKVIAFLDLFGDWDPSLAVVMASALFVTSIGYQVVFTQDKPVLADKFQVPTRSDLNPRLIIGASMFGIGWGLVGLCPGPAIADLFVGGNSILIFLVSLGVGMTAFEVFDRFARTRAATVPQ